MMKTFVCLVSVLLISVMQSAYSADERGRYWIYGEGKQSCRAYLEASRAGGTSQSAYISWVAGYLTSSNRLTEKTYDLLGVADFQAALVWIATYCKKHPKNTIYMAMANMTAVHYPNRRRSK